MTPEKAFDKVISYGASERCSWSEALAAVDLTEEEKKLATAYYREQLIAAPRPNYRALFDSEEGW